MKRANIGRNHTPVVRQTSARYLFPSTGNLPDLCFDHMHTNVSCHICPTALFLLTSQTLSIRITCTQILFRRHCPNLLHSSSSTMLCSRVAECRCSAQADVTLIEDHHIGRTAVRLGSGQFWSQCSFCRGKQPIPRLSASALLS